MDRSFLEAVSEAVGAIPEGTVATYGQIAERVGVGPRQVGLAMRQMPEDLVCPWFRVVNAQGRISHHSGESRQRCRLEAEGVAFDAGDRIDLDVYRWEHGD